MKSRQSHSVLFGLIVFSVAVLSVSVIGSEVLSLFVQVGQKVQISQLLAEPIQSLATLFKSLENLVAAGMVGVLVFAFTARITSPALPDPDIAATVPVVESSVQVDDRPIAESSTDLKDDPCPVTALVAGAEANKISTIVPEVICSETQYAWKFCQVRNQGPKYSGIVIRCPDAPHLPTVTLFSAFERGAIDPITLCKKLEIPNLSKLVGKKFNSRSPSPYEALLELAGMSELQLA